MLLTFQYGLQPTRAQHRHLETILEGQRLLYNAAIEERIDAWRKSSKSITRVDQNKSLTQVRADDPDGYGGLPANLSRWPLKKVDEAFQAFFRRNQTKNGKAGFPRFRSKTRWRSFGFTEFCGIRLINGALTFRGLCGRLRLHMHRPLPDGASIRSCVLTKEGRAWRVALHVELPEVHTVRREAGAIVGIDWGVESLAVMSTGERIENPRFGKKAAAVIRIAGRRLSRAKKGSRRRQKTVMQLRRLQRKLANRRRSHLHRTTASIARRFGAVAIEKLRVMDMTASPKGTLENPGKNVRQKAGLNREILDTAPGMFAAMLAYKVAKTGGWFAAVDARNTSQECSECGHLVRKDLRERIHRCAHCETELHRDLNAATNVLNRAVAGPWSGFAQHRLNVSNGTRRSGNLTSEFAA